MPLKGGITLFLSLMLIVMLTVIEMSYLCVQTAAGRAQLANAMDQAMLSLFSRYDRDVLDKYDLFFLNAGDGENLRMEILADAFEDAAGYILEPGKNLGNLRGKNLISCRIKETAVTDYLLASDFNAGVAADQAVRYMKKTAALQGLSLTKEWLTGTEETEKAESYGKSIEEAHPAGDYQELLEEALANGQSAETESSDGENRQPSPDVPETAKASGQNDGNGMTDGSADSGEISGAQALKSVMSIEKLRKTSVLNLVCRNVRNISERKVSKEAFLSSRSREKGMGTVEMTEDLSSAEAALWLNEYLVTHFGSCLSPETGEGLRYPLEEILQGKASDIKNLEAVATKLLLIREGVNFLYIRQDAGLTGQARSAALAISSLLLMPEIADGLEAVIEVGWAYCESLLDVRTLLDGGRIPAFKTMDTWQISTLTDMMDFQNRMDELRHKNGSGLGYRDYLRIFLAMLSMDKKCTRMADMLEHEIRADGRESFRLDHCLSALGLEVRAESAGGIILSGEKSMSYYQLERSSQ